jgi:hypothetical protein
MTNVTKYDNIIDSSDVIARIEELESEQEDLLDGHLFDDLAPKDQADFLEWEEENGHELDTLRKLADEAKESPDWQHGETLIRDSYFQEYAQDLAEDCGMIPKDNAWPCTCIDWERAARELQMDYFSVEFDGIVYWIRY